MSVQSLPQRSANNPLATAPLSPQPKKDSWQSRFDRLERNNPIVRELAEPSNYMAGTLGAIIGYIAERLFRRGHQAAVNQAIWFFALNFAFAAIGIVPWVKYRLHKRPEGEENPSNPVLPKQWTT